MRHIGVDVITCNQMISGEIAKDHRITHEIREIKKDNMRSEVVILDQMIPEEIKLYEIQYDRLRSHETRSKKMQ